MTSLKKHKYGAKATMVDGIRFASLKESRRYQELKLLEKAGEIHNLTLQPSFNLHSGVGWTIVCRYVGDFQYWDRRSTKTVVEDAKGCATPMYKLKRKMMQAEYGIEIVEV